MDQLTSLYELDQLENQYVDSERIDDLEMEFEKEIEENASDF